MDMDGVRSNGRGIDLRARCSAPISAPLRKFGDGSAAQSCVMLPSNVAATTGIATRPPALELEA